MKLLRKIFNYWEEDKGKSFRINSQVVEHWFDKTQSLVFSEESAKEEELIIKKLILNDSNTKILDLGCGDGRYAKIFLHNVKKYIGVDISNNFITKNKEHIKSSKLEFYHLAAHLFTYSEKFDYILMIGLLTYMNDDEINQMCHNCSKMLKEDGKIIVRNVVNNEEKRKYFDDKYFFLKHIFKSPRYQIIRRTEKEVVEVFTKEFKLLKTENIQNTAYRVYVWTKSPNA